jgi:hypothetical protein
MSNEKSSSIGFGGLLTLIFITLKLCGIINWSWWWVLSPLWIPFAIFLFIALIVLIISIFK